MNIRLLFSIIVFIALLSLFGCNQEEIDKQEGNLPGENLHAPPSLTISVGEETIETVRGTYSWSYKHGDGTSTGINADSAAPPDLVEGQISADVTPNTEVSLNFEETPMDYQVRIWDSENNIIGTYNEVVPSQHIGRVIYEVLANWEQGTVSYAFSLNVKENYLDLIKRPFDPNLIEFYMGKPMKFEKYTLDNVSDGVYVDGVQAHTGKKVFTIYSKDESLKTKNIKVNIEDNTLKIFVIEGKIDTDREKHIVYQTSTSENPKKYEVYRSNKLEKSKEIIYAIE